MKKKEKLLKNGNMILFQMLNTFVYFRKKVASNERVIRKRIESMNKQDRKPSSSDLS